VKVTMFTVYRKQTKLGHYHKFVSSDIAFPFSSVDPPKTALTSWDQIISDIASK